MTITRKVKPKKSGIEVCPTCKRPIYTGGPKRICAKCGKQIARREKWSFGLDKKCRHRNCSDPISYK